MFLQLTISLVIWSTYYFLLQNTFHKNSVEWISRVVALTHSFISCLLAEWCIFTTPWLFDKLGDANIDEYNFAVYVSAGYFMFETAWCVYMRTEGMLMFLHHITSLSSLIACSFLQRSGAEVVLTTWGAELTNPFLQIRWFLLERKMYETNFAFINDFIFIGMFFIVRLGLGSVLMFNVHYSVKTTMLFKFGGYLFYFIGLLWSIQIAKFAFKRFYKLSSKKLD